MSDFERSCPLGPDPHNSELSFNDKSRIYCSLVALVKAEYPFDDALQNRATRFLKNIDPEWNEQLAAKLVTDLVRSSAVAAAFAFLQATTLVASTTLRDRLMKSDLVSKVFATVQPHTLPISGNTTIFDDLIDIIDRFAELATPPFIRNLGITASGDKFNHREMIFQKVLLPSSDLLLEIGPFHIPTLEFVLASPIVTAFSSCLSFFEDNSRLWDNLNNTNISNRTRRKQGPEVSQSGKRMMQTLFSEGFEDTLEKILMNDKGGHYGSDVVEKCHSISQLLGSNVKRPQ
ncbi:hypothetical protein BLNAU_3481 [Blattamonas nauphoetae]|uniref:Uncharacterized protein n=1 Tax=Blattamonas nauphoetae TaxID=2049346 RepID=A0ABQ9YD38_9EUKA|nr:hypothetical protein BLNAU_3481 [Blattamonas nauphoetae]